MLIVSQRFKNAKTLYIDVKNKVFYSILSEMNISKNKC